MSYKVVLAALGVALAAVLGTWGASAAMHSGEAGPELSVTPTVGVSVAPSPDQSPTPWTLVSASPSSTSSPTADESAAPAAPGPVAPKPPAPPAHPTNTAFGDIAMTLTPAASMTGGPRSLNLEGDLRLAAGATVSCQVVMGGSTWPTTGNYLGEEWVGDFHVFMTSVDITLPAAEYPYTASCATSDGVTWGRSGVADQAGWHGP